MRNEIMRVAVIQEKTPPYRVPFFTQLNQRLEGGLTVFSGERYEKASFDQQIIPVRSMAGWVLPGQLDKSTIAQFDLVVMMFDLRWLSLYQLLFFHHKKTVLWGQGMGSIKILASVKAKLINRSLGFIAYEKTGEQFFSQHNVLPAKLAYAGNTVDVVNHALSKKPRRYFIYMGRLQARKELDQLIRAFALLPKQLQQRSGLLFLGDGGILGELEAQVKSSGLNEFCQFVPGSYDLKLVKSYLDEAIAYVSPGHLGLGVLHAFACGVPVISRRAVKHAPEAVNIKDSVNGFLTGESDQSVMEAMQRYLTSAELHHRHCSAAYCRYTEHRTMTKMVTRFVDALDGFLTVENTG